MPDYPEEYYAELTDYELLKLSASEDLAAFDEIAKRYHSRLYETAQALLFSHTQATEAVNTMLANARRRLNEYKGDSLLLTWLCRKLIKHILDNYELPPLPKKDSK